MKKKSKKKIKYSRVISLTLAVFSCWIIIISCAHYPQNVHLPEYSPGEGYRYPDTEETAEQDPLFIVLAFSGGGTRAAALSYGVLKKLSETPLPGKNGQTVLNEVDVISSVSGGSFTAAYYGLFKEKIFTDFESKFLNRNIQGELFNKLLIPWNWIRLASPNFSRIDLAAELYNETVFDGSKFNDLIGRNQHPFIAINATNMTTGSRFTFTQDQFDFLGSDLSVYPVSRAVAASSAFPFLLAPISLVNHATSAGYKLPVDIKLGMKTPIVNERRYLWAVNRAIYYQDKTGHPYLHLMDGGLADNLGLRYITDGYQRTSGFLTKRKSKIKHLVVIAVNAKTQPPENLDKKESAPGLADMAFKTATVSMDNYTFETMQMTDDLLSASRKAMQNVKACQKQIEKFCGAGNKLPSLGQKFQVYVIEINFLHVKNPVLRAKLLALPTTFSLKPEEVAELIEVGGELLEQSSGFQELIQNLSEGD